MNPTTPVAIVLAAGRGERVGGDTPKQVLALGGRPLAVYSIEQHLRLGHHVIVVASAATRPTIEAALGAAHHDGALTVVNGGATRRASVLSGIGAVPPSTAGPTAVVLRNAASPNTPDDVITACIAGVDRADGMQAYVASQETTLVRDGQQLDRVLSREATGFTRDPTVYRRELLDAIGAEMVGGAGGETTLDIARRLGARIGLVESPASNIKVTTADDMARVAAAMGLVD